jgi:DNA-binding response OmpR family regulator
MCFPNILIVSHNRNVHRAFADALGKCGLNVAVADTAEKAEAILKRDPIALVFCSDEIPHADIGVLIRQEWRQAERPPVIVFSRLDDSERYLKFLRAGAFDYVLYPPAGREFERILRLGLRAGEKAESARAASAA